MQKIFQIKSVENQNIIEQISIPIPNPDKDEVLIKHKAIGVNFAEYDILRSNSYNIQEPIIPGIEAVGVIEKVGSNVKNFTEGQRVGYATAVSGAYSEYRVIKSMYLFPIPDVITDEAAAVNMLKGMTAHYLLRRTFFVTEGMTIVIHGAASNVGRLMMRLAREHRINVIATVGSDDKKQIATDLKAQAVFNYTQEDFVKGIQDIVGPKGVNVVYDFIGLDILKKSLKIIGSFGLAVSAGASAGRAVPIDPLLLTSKALFLTSPRLNWYKQDKTELMRSAKEICTYIAAKVFPDHADKKYSFDEIPTALEDIKTRTVGSKVILL